MVRRVARKFARQGWRDDGEETDDLHDGLRAPRVLRAKYTAREDGLRGQECRENLVGYRVQNIHGRDTTVDRSRCHSSVSVPGGGARLRDWNIIDFSSRCQRDDQTILFMIDLFIERHYNCWKLRWAFTIRSCKELVTARKRSLQFSFFRGNRDAIAETRHDSTINMPADVEPNLLQRTKWNFIAHLVAL